MRVCVCVWVCCALTYGPTAEMKRDAHTYVVYFIFFLFTHTNVHPIKYECLRCGQIYRVINALDCNILDALASVSHHFNSISLEWDIMNHRSAVECFFFFLVEKTTNNLFLYFFSNFPLASIEVNNIFLRMPNFYFYLHTVYHWTQVSVCSGNVVIRTQTRTTIFGHKNYILYCVRTTIIDDHHSSRWKRKW